MPKSNTIFLCSRGPTPARSHSAARLGRASLRRLARAAGALLLCSRGATPLALTRRRALGALPSGASLGPRALCSYARGAPPRSLSLGGAPWARLPPAPRSGRGRPGSILPHDAHHDTLHLHLLGIDENRLHRSVGRLQTNLAARVAIKLLERHIRASQQRNHHFPIVGGLAIFDADEIAVADLFVDHRIAANAQHVSVALADEVFGDRDRFVRGDRFDGQARGDKAQKRQLDGAAARPRRHHFHRTTAVPGSLDEAFLLKVRQVFVYRGERREPKATADLLEARRVAVLLDEFIEVIEDLALPFRERKHRRSPWFL